MLDIRSLNRFSLEFMIVFLWQMNLSISSRLESVVDWIFHFLFNFIESWKMLTRVAGFQDMKRV